MPSPRYEDLQNGTFPLGVIAWTSAKQNRAVDYVNLSPVVVQLVSEEWGCTKLRVEACFGRECEPGERVGKRCVRIQRAPGAAVPPGERGGHRRGGRNTG